MTTLISSKVEWCSTTCSEGLMVVDEGRRGHECVCVAVDVRVEKTLRTQTLISKDFFMAHFSIYSTTLGSIG